MKLVIDIPEEVKQKIDGNLDSCDLEIYDCVMLATKNGILLPKNHGDLISRDKALELVNYALAENKDVLEVLENMPSAEKTANKININEYVKVKLTDYGKDIFYHQYDDLNKFYGKEIIKPRYPTVDSDGYTSFQLWCFINLYGKYIDMGVQNVIEPLEIVFESDEKTEEMERSKRMTNIESIKRKDGDEWINVIFVRKWD